MWQAIRLLDLGLEQRDECSFIRHRDSGCESVLWSLLWLQDQASGIRGRTNGRTKDSSDDRKEQTLHPLLLPTRELLFSFYDSLVSHSLSPSLCLTVSSLVPCTGNRDLMWVVFTTYSHNFFLFQMFHQIASSLSLNNDCHNKIMGKTSLFHFPAPDNRQVCEFWSFQIPIHDLCSSLKRKLHPLTAEMIDLRTFEKEFWSSVSFSGQSVLAAQFPETCCKIFLLSLALRLAIYLFLPDFNCWTFVVSIWRSVCSSLYRHRYLAVSFITCSLIAVMFLFLSICVSIFSSLCVCRSKERTWLSVRNLSKKIRRKSRFGLRLLSQRKTLTLRYSLSTNDRQKAEHDDRNFLWSPYSFGDFSPFRFIFMFKHSLVATTTIRF